MITVFVSFLIFIGSTAAGLFILRLQDLSKFVRALLALILWIPGIGVLGYCVYHELQINRTGPSGFEVIAWFMVWLIFLWSCVLALAARRQRKLPPTERAAAEARVAEMSARLKYGSLNAALICPHCQTKGRVHVKPIDRKVGISGAKATSALLTGGVSLLAVGLSRNEKATAAHCDNCSSDWLF